MTSHSDTNDLSATERFKLELADLRAKAEVFSSEEDQTLLRNDTTPSGGVSDLDTPLSSFEKRAHAIEFAEGELEEGVTDFAPNKFSS